MKYIESIYDVESLHNIILQFKNNPNWTASHVAAELEITECFENAEFMNEMENSLKSDDITPLHIACKVWPPVNKFLLVTFQLKMQISLCTERLDLEGKTTTSKQ